MLGIIYKAFGEGFKNSSLVNSCSPFRKSRRILSKLVFSSLIGASFRMDVIQILERGYKPLIETQLAEFKLLASNSDASEESITTSETLVVRSVSFALDILQQLEQQKLLPEESLIVSYDLMADFHIYLLEVFQSVSDRRVVICNVNASYESAYSAAKARFHPLQQTRLGLMFKFSAFLESVNLYDQAASLSYAVISDLNSSNVELDQEKSVSVELLKEKFTLCSACAQFHELLRMEQLDQDHSSWQVFELMKLIFPAFMEEHLNPPPVPADHLDAPFPADHLDVMYHLFPVADAVEPVVEAWPWNDEDDDAFWGP